MENEWKAWVDDKDNTKYVLSGEKPDLYLKKSLEALYIDLGRRAFLIDRDGYYNPRILLKMDFTEKAKEVLEKYSHIVVSKICPHWKYMKESGLLSDSIEIYYMVMGVLIGDVPRAIAVAMAAIIAKRGLSWLCRK